VPSEIDEDLFGLIGGFYDAVIDPELWSIALERMRLYFGFQLGALSAIALPGGTAAIQATANIPDDYLVGMAGYNDDAARMWGDPAKIAAFPLEEPVRNSSMAGPDIWSGNPFYEDWAKPQGLIDQVAIFLARDRTMIASVAFGLRESGPPLSEDGIAALRLLAPHIRRAVTISRILEVATTRANTFEAALEASPSAVALVDAEMGIVHANAAAAEMLKRGDPIRDVGGRLTFRDELVPGQLQAAVNVASENEGRLERRGIGIPARLRDGTPLATHVMPLKSRPLRGTMRQRATAAVFVADNGGAPMLPADALSLLYGLTPAEARVFELIVAGESTEEAARTLGVAPSTLRTHLLRVFEKTDRHSRAELVTLSREVRLPG